MASTDRPGVHERARPCCPSAAAGVGVERLYRDHAGYEAEIAAPTGRTYTWVNRHVSEGKPRCVR